MVFSKNEELSRKLVAVENDLERSEDRADEFTKKFTGSCSILRSFKDRLKDPSKIFGNI